MPPTVLHRRTAIAAAVIAAHACFLLLLLASEALRYRAAAAAPDDRLEVYFVAAPEVPEPQDADAASERPPTATRNDRRGRSRPEPGNSPPADPDETAASPSGSSAIHPPRDWDGAARHAADAAARAPGAVPDCEPSGRPDATRPRCPKSGRDFEWRPEEPKAGFKGGLPYVKLGKRCIVMPPFFGCGIGKLPEANGRLFDGMDDVDRDRSSVPEVPR